MSITIYNSLTRQKEILKPLDGKTIRMYSCGVTVYDRCHIGHARSLYIFDVIRKYLKFRGYDVHFIRNITDVDDKIINKAIAVNKSSREVAEDNIKLYYDDLAAMAIDRADFEPKATDNIPGMIAHIEGLLKKDIAYEVDGDVYFSVRKFPEYGKLSGQGIEKMQEAVRIEKDPKKKDPLDFALWKRSGENEPYWESPWGRGRPGWHIECSVMSLKHLNCETLDIHAGGRDLIFPHHENEVAQAEALTGKPFARYWIHHGLLTINGQKMAKSAGNFITIADALKKYSVEQIKLFFLSAHYASPIDITEEKMVEAHKALQRFTVLFGRLDSLKGQTSKGEQSFTDELSGKYEQALIDAMDDDFNSAKALAVLFEFVNDINKFLDTKKGDAHYIEKALLAVKKIKAVCSEVFGLFKEAAEEEVSETIKDLLNQRQAARKNKDFKLSDQLRDQLLGQGIVVEDTPAGQRWRRA